MARKNPIPEHDLQICRTMRAVRKTLGVSMEAFARMAGLGTANLASMENERNRWMPQHLATVKPALEEHVRRCTEAVAGVPSDPSSATRG